MHLMHTAHTPWTWPPSPRPPNLEQGAVQATSALNASQSTDRDFLSPLRESHQGMGTVLFNRAIAVIGPPAVGKTTLTMQLGQQSGRRVFRLREHVPQPILAATAASAERLRACHADSEGLPRELSADPRQEFGTRSPMGRGIEVINVIQCAYSSPEDPRAVSP